MTLRSDVFAGWGMGMGLVVAVLGAELESIELKDSECDGAGGGEVVCGKQSP